MSAWLPWVVVIGLTLVAALLFWRSRQAAAARSTAELSLGYAERTLRELSLASEWYAAQLRAMQEAQVSPLLVLAADRTLVGMNAGARTLFGSAAKIGQTLIQATRSAELDDLAAHCLAGGADVDRQVVLGRAQQPFRARAVRIGDRDAGDDYSGVVVALQDLGELQRLGRSRRDFIANISHELRTPLTSIRLIVDTLRGIAPLNTADRDDLLEKISVETEALGQLSQELLDLAQIESGQTLIRMAPVPVAELLEGVTRRFGPQAERKHQAIVVIVSAGLMVLADEAQVTRVLGNLLHNAIKFTPDHGRISLNAFRQEQDVVFEVGDTGPGIPSEDLNRVFERFYRGDRSRASGGTGLGLAIAKHVVEAHSGRIWVESEGRAGQGAVFRFTLPASD